MKALGDYFSDATIVNNLGQTVERERETAANYVLALKWYTLAAFHDFSQQLRTPTPQERNAQILAQERLPAIRAKMTNAQVDAAEKLVSDTYERGSERDILYVAEMYRRGAGLRKDNVRAYELFLVASERGVPDASLALQQMRDGGLISSQEIDRAERLAANWRPPLPALHEGDTPELRELRKLKAELEELRLQEAP